MGLGTREFGMRGRVRQCQQHGWRTDVWPNRAGRETPARPGGATQEVGRERRLGNERLRSCDPAPRCTWLDALCRARSINRHTVESSARDGRSHARRQCWNQWSGAATLFLRHGLSSFCRTIYAVGFWQRAFKSEQSAAGPRRIIQRRHELHLQYRQFSVLHLLSVDHIDQRRHLECNPAVGRPI